MDESYQKIFENTKRRITIYVSAGEPYSFTLHDTDLNRNILSEDINMIKLVCSYNYTIRILDEAERWIKEVNDKIEMERRGIREDTIKEIEDNIKKDVMNTRRRLIANKKKKHGIQKDFWMREHEKLWGKYRQYLYISDRYGGYERDRLINTHPLFKFNSWYADQISDIE